MVTKAKRRSRADAAQDRLSAVMDELHALGVWRMHLMIGAQNGKAFKYLTMTGMQEAVLFSNIDDFTLTLKAKPEEMVVAETTAEEYVGDND